VSEKIQDAYQSAYFQCALDDAKIPSARAIQTLVKAWREMRGWSKRQQPRTFDSRGTHGFPYSTGDRRTAKEIEMQRRFSPTLTGLLNECNFG